MAIGVVPTRWEKPGALPSRPANPYPMTWWSPGTHDIMVLLSA